MIVDTLHLLDILARVGVRGTFPRMKREFGAAQGECAPKPKLPPQL